MALYVKLFSSFWTHRKTARLRASLGEDALWLVPRIWSYAAENQPDGDFSSYTATELALLIGYFKDATRMLEALQQAGFMDGMEIHGWAEYNEYHKTFGDRAKKAAEARWESHNKKKEAKKKTRDDKIGEETSNASSIVTSKDKGSMEEISGFCLSIQLTTSDGEFCFHKWEANGWTNGNSKIKDWKATIRSWKSAGYMPSQKTKNGTHSSTPTESTRNLGTANQGRAHLYRTAKTGQNGNVQLPDVPRPAA